ncbi:MAG: M56 family metallopeptidase [Ferruginibacter sp.]
MPVYFEYALKVSLCLAVIFLFYQLLLKQITWYKWNRFFLLTFSALSFLVPLIDLNLFIETQQLEFIPLVNFLPALTNKIPQNLIPADVGFNYRTLLPMVYIFIVLLLFIRLFIRIIAIKKIKSGAILTLSGDLEIYDVPKPILPFSFLNGIFINKNNYTNTELQEIVDHERVHVKQKHTIDVLIAELICILNWYNPFAWLIKKAVRENLEFIADDAVLRKGVDRKDYQYLLLKVTGIVPSSIASSFTITSLKNRIRMMNKTKNGRLHLLKFVLVVPLITLLLLAFRQKQAIYNSVSSPKIAIAKTYILSSLTYAVPDKKVEAEVEKDKENCLLKTGQTLDLDLIFNEKTRLLNFLGKNGHANIDPHAITFMIDTTLGNNSFSIQVNINFIKKELSKSKGVSTGEPTAINPQIDPVENRVLAAGDHGIRATSLNLQNEDK